MMLARGEMLSFCRGMTCGKARVQHIPLHSRGIAYTGTHPLNALAVTRHATLERPLRKITFCNGPE